jgi:predicted nucleic acid-binding protein
MILIDTSSWIHQMRERGDLEVRQRVVTLLATGQAAWCALVRLELWAGVRDEKERKVLREYEQVIPELDITSEVWDEACALSNRCRKAGKTAPNTDYLIAACARHHKVSVESADAHFTFLMKL